MPITRTPIYDDSGLGLDGTVIDNAWKQEFYNQIDALAGGPWQVLTFNAANFTANNGATWAVSNAQTAWAFDEAQKLMFVQVNIIASTLSGAASNLYVAVPAGRQSPYPTLGPTFINSPGAFFEVGVVIVTGAQLQIHRPAIGNFGAGAISGYVTAVFPVA